MRTDALRVSGWRSGGLNTEVVGERELGFRELVTSQVIDRIPHHVVVDVDRADLVDSSVFARFVQPY